MEDTSQEPRDNAPKGACGSLGSAVDNSPYCNKAGFQGPTKWRTSMCFASAAKAKHGTIMSCKDPQGAAATS